MHFGHDTQSLIVQILPQPQTTSTTVEISLGCFERLLEPKVDVEEALLILQKLGCLVPPYMHIVIGGIQELEDRSDIQHTQNLSQVLRQVMSMG
jgi:hypothetical protein